MTKGETVTVELERIPQELRLTSLELSSTILAAGHPLITAVYNERGRVEFVFRFTEELDMLVENFAAGTARVEPSSLFRAYRHLKDRIYELKDGKVRAVSL